MSDLNQKGFKGLVSLASNVEIASRSTKKSSLAKEKDYLANASNQPKPSISNQENQSDNSNSGFNNSSEDWSKNNNSQKWGWAVLAAIVIVALVIDIETNDDEKTSNYNKPPSYTQKPLYEAPKPKPAAKITYEKPSVGQGSRLYMPQIRWCVREQNYLDSTKVNNYDRSEVQKYNNRVNDYNSRCSNFRYRAGELDRAKRQVAQDIDNLFYN